MLDVTPTAVDRLVLLRVELRLPVLGSHDLIVIAERLIKEHARILGALPRKTVRQVPPVRQIVLHEQSVIGLVAGAMTGGCGHVPILASNTSN